MKPDEAEEIESLETRESPKKQKTLTDIDIDIDIVAERKINEWEKWAYIFNASVAISENLKFQNWLVVFVGKKWWVFSWLIKVLFDQT